MIGKEDEKEKGGDIYLVHCEKEIEREKNNSCME